MLQQLVLLLYNVSGGLNMKKNDTIAPFANGVKKAKDDFKQMIDKMDDNDFLDMMFFFEQSLNEHFDDCACCEDCEDCEDCEHFDDCDDYESEFSGEMINFKCAKCGKFSALPIEIVNDIYEETQEPLTECFKCEANVSPVYYKAPDGKIFEN